MKNNWPKVMTFSFMRRALAMLAVLLLPVVPALAQATAAASPAMADTLRDNGKIYVVVAVIVVVLVGLLLYLVSIDRKVSRLERELRD